MKAERLHLTLHFLGDVPAQRVADIARGLRVPAEPFDLTLGHGEVWPNGVAVLRPFAMPPALTRLHAALAIALAGLQVPLDARPYKPHVTLARRAHARSAAGARARSSPGPSGTVTCWCVRCPRAAATKCIERYV